MEYCSELPRRFKTWVEFYDKLKESNLLEGYESVIYIEEPKVNVKVNNDVFPKKEKEVELRFLVRTIKDNALEELLSDRLTKDDVIKFTQQVERSLDYSGKSQWIAQTLSTVKRILLTQSKK